MPGIVAHMVVAKLVGERLKINCDEFIEGNILPDILPESTTITHHKTKGKLYLIPDISYWREILDLTDNKQLGYYTHLLLDRHFLEEYVPNKVKNKNAFIDNSMYRDYDILNHRLVKRFDLDTEKIKQILSQKKDNVNRKKLDYNISCLSMREEGETENLDEKDFSEFLFDISQTISEEIEEYASKHSKLSICPRQREKRKYKKK